MEKRINIPLPGVIEVHNTTNYKGNERTVLVVDGQQVLYREGHVDYPDATADGFRYSLGRMFVAWLRHEDPSMFRELEHGNPWSGWSETTDREIDAENYSTTTLIPEEN